MTPWLLFAQCLRMPIICHISDHFPRKGMVDFTEKTCAQSCVNFLFNKTIHAHSQNKLSNQGGCKNVKLEMSLSTMKQHIQLLRYAHDHFLKKDRNFYF